MASLLVCPDLEDRFFRVGFSDTASAGRALASRGLVVLQASEADQYIDEPLINIEETGTDVYLGAIDKLVADGLVDPSKVGISGYSFSGLTAAASIAFSPTSFHRKRLPTPCHTLTRILRRLPGKTLNWSLISFCGTLISADTARRMRVRERRC